MLNLSSILGKDRGRGACPACRKAGAFSWNSAADGTILLKCFKCQDTPAIVSALGLTLRDLFPDRGRRRAELDARTRFRQQLRETQQRTVDEMIVREERRIAIDLEAKHGYRVPLLTTERNAARERVGRILGVKIRRVKPAEWEGWPPHDRDPAWPTLWETHERQWRIAKFKALYPGVKPYRPFAGQLSVVAQNAIAAKVREALRALSA